MDKQMLISLSILAVLLEAFLIFVFIKYKQGRIDHNPFGAMVLKEGKILYYSLFQWGKTRPANQTAVFPLLKGSNYFWLFLALLHEQILEMIVFHIYLRNEEPALAYTISAVHIYSIIYMIGDYNWLRNTPITVSNNRVEMKIGARRELSFHISEIDSIQKATLQYNKSGGIIYEKGVFHTTAFPRVLTRIFGMGDELRYEIIFKQPVTARGYFGLKKEVKKAFIYIEQSDELAELLKLRMAECSDEEEEIQVQTIKEPLVNWRVYFLLLAINLAGALALAPYAMAREGFHKELGVSEGVFTLIFAGQTLIEAGILILLALLMARTAAVKLPILESFIMRTGNWRKHGKDAGKAVFYGVLTGIVICITSYFISKPLGIDNSSINEPDWKLGLLGSFGAGTTEETMFRLFFVTLLLWLTVKIKKKKPGKTAIWISIFSAALLFGALHYGVAASAFDMTLGLVLGMLLINGIGGIVFGAIFVYAGLEYAMIAHIFADIVIHVVAPQFI
ncbi:CPBP family intramembrane metalloprotease [Bacillus infantis]|uniref:CPBP family intramembrane glutamic endopeptidase n=1 Tax=Bacillus infantis TaxID=324767 RepID=UPI00101C90DB|nr:CPBP family intramembrane glutamic endopeptidase [Bacillus infantis]RYI29486.1 CPBP family intramembrane metalloprotease [Bacillus infantis]